MFSQMTYQDAIARWISRLMLALCCLCAVVIVLLLALVAWYIVYRGISSISWDLFTKVPGGSPDHPGGMKHAIIGTLILLALASGVGVPLGILAGIYLAEYSARSHLATPVRFVADVLAGVPSIVIGILGYELLVVPFSTGKVLGISIPVLQHLGIHGYNGWAGAGALALIMVPMIARTTEEMLRTVPQNFREAAIALGCSKAGTILKVVLPAATGSVVTGVMLALARVAGETAPLLFTALGSRLLTTNPNYAFPSLTVQIFTYATGPYDEFRRLAWGGILVLITILLLLNLSVRWMTRPGG